MRLFLAATALAAWNLAGYPAFCALRARFARPFRPVRARPVRSVTVVTAAHDEASCIAGRVRNVLENGAWRAVEMIVVSDGSADGTARLAEEAGARVLEQERGGKIAALHRAIRAARGDVVVITDANTRFEPGAIDRLVEPLSDPDVGIAAGDLRYENEGGSASSSGEGLYWRYETWIKRRASEAGLLLMGAGGIYAFRREDWPFDLPGDLADDSYVPLALHRAGRVNLFVPEAVAFERAGTRMEEEWRRRVRMVAQDARVARALSFGWPRPATVFALVSHKVLRWLLFPLLLAILATARGAARALHRRNGAAALLALPLRAAPFAAGALLAAGAVADRAGRRIPVASVFFYLVGATAAASWGLVLGIGGRSRATWEKAATTRETP